MTEHGLTRVPQSNMPELEQAITDNGFRCQLWPRGNHPFFVLPWQSSMLLTDFDKMVMNTTVTVGRFRAVMYITYSMLNQFMQNDYLNLLEYFFRVKKLYRNSTVCLFLCIVSINKFMTMVNWPFTDQK